MCEASSLLDAQTILPFYLPQQISDNFLFSLLNP